MFKNLAPSQWHHRSLTKAVKFNKQIIFNDSLQLDLFCIDLHKGIVYSRFTLPCSRTYQYFILQRWYQIYFIWHSSMTVIQDVFVPILFLSHWHLEVINILSTTRKRQQRKMTSENETFYEHLGEYHAQNLFIINNEKYRGFLLTACENVISYSSYLKSFFIVDSISHTLSCLYL